MSEHKSRIEGVAHRAAIGIVGLTLALGIGFFFWAADRGFDLTDEGVYLLLYKNPTEFSDGFTSYHKIGAALYHWVGGSIVGMRVLGFVGTALGIGVFWWSFAHFLRRSFSRMPLSPMQETLAGLVTGLSLLTAFCWPPPTFSYNTLAGIGLLIGASTVLWALVPCRSGVDRVRAVVSVLGFALATAALLLVKGSTAVGFAVFSLGFIALWPSVSWNHRIGLFVALGLATTLAVSGIFTLAPDMQGAWDFLRYSISSLLAGTGATGMIERHIGEAVDLLLRTLRTYYFPLLTAAVFVLALRLSRVTEARRQTLAVGGILVVLAIEIGAAVVKHGFQAGVLFRNGSFLAYSSLFLLLFILAIGISVGARKLTKSEVFGGIVLLCWLFLLPFIGALGTTHRLYVNAILHVTFGFAAIVSLAIYLDNHLKVRVVLPAVSVFMAALAMGQFYSGFIESPYRLTTSKYLQNEPVIVSEDRNVLRLDTQTASFLGDIRSALEAAGFRPGNDIVALFNMPGLVYAVGGVSPGRPWYFDGYGEEGDRENIRSLKRVGAERVKRAIIFQRNDDPRAASYLAALGIDFPGDYLEVGQATHPLVGRIRLWAPAGAGVKNGG